ncbi:hypothetical protein [Sphingomonas asaccharolytica]|uniref:hypothetical protein n=1 Tax=Sphingomonas asaccharolytica TaxID=40681 RepID=UPI00082F5BF2|nr:hypothetical protein [Sphingomonas asaccharolytica]
MPQKYEVTGPDGATYLVEAPEGATEADIIGQVQAAAGGTKPQRMSPDDEAAYVAMARDPKTKPADLLKFTSDRGFNLNPADVDAFYRAKSKKGAEVSGGIRYNLPAAPPKPKKDRPNTGLENTSATAQETLDGILPGFGRTMAGVGGATGNTIAALLGRREWDPMGAYEHESGQSDLDRGRLEQDNPALANTAYGTGVVGGFLLPEAKVLKGGGMLKAAGNGVITGAGYGALSGFMNPTRDGRLANAENGAMFGGTIGGVAAPAVRGLGAIGGAIRRNVPGVDEAATFVGDIPRMLSGRGRTPGNASANAQAERILGDQLPGSNISTGMGAGDVSATPDAIAAEVARRQSHGVPAMAADVTDKGRRVTAWALSGNGPMATRARNTLAQRQAQSGSRVRAAITGELGPAVDPIAETQAITERARAAAGPDYQAAYAQGSPVVITDELSSLMSRPAFRQALPQAYNNILNRGGSPEALGFRFIPHGTDVRLPPNAPHAVTPEGTFVLDRAPSFEAFDQVVRTLNKGIKRSDLTGRPILDNESGGINDVMQNLDGYLKRTNPAYATAKGNYADEMAIRDAMNRGQDIGKLGGPEISEQLRTMPPHAQEAWMAGARSSLADDAINAGLKPTANVPQRIRSRLGLSGAGDPALGDTQKLQAIETMSGRPGVINRLDDRLESEDHAYKTFAETYGNSKTAGRQAMDEAMSGDSSGAALKIGRKLATGDVLGTITDVLFHGGSRGTLRFKRDVQDRIAEIMTATNPTDVRGLMQAITDRAEKDDNFRRLLNRAGIGPAKVAALQAAGMDNAAPPLDDSQYDPPQGVDYVDGP